LVFWVQFITFSDVFGDAAKFDAYYPPTPLEIKFDQPPIIDNGRTLVPIRAIVEAMGATVDWVAASQTATIVKGAQTVKMQISNVTMTNNGVPIQLDVPPKIVGGRTLIPARAIAEAFGAKVEWNADENAGFSAAAKCWLGINANYRYINYASQNNDPASVLNFYKTLIAFRQKNECLKSGEFIPIFANQRLMVYQRRLEQETYSIALNFSSRKVKLPEKAAVFFHEAPLITSASLRVLNGILFPWEGVLCKS